MDVSLAKHETLLNCRIRVTIAGQKFEDTLQGLTVADQQRRVGPQLQRIGRADHLGAGMGRLRFLAREGVCWLGGRQRQGGKDCRPPQRPPLRRAREGTRWLVGDQRRGKAATVVDHRGLLQLRGGNAAAGIEQRDQRAATGGGKTTAFYINMDIEIRTNPNTLIRDAIVKQPVSGQFFEIALGKPSLHPAIQWTSLPIVVETDCLIVLHLLDSKEKDRSMFASIIQEAKALVVGGGREIVIRKDDSQVSGVREETGDDRVNVIADGMFGGYLTNSSANGATTFLPALDELDPF
ncbi:hypothetical protein OsI_19073 [Oryza sativa Indica Group]|uniref:Uncharacterized protein n=1 Tax=Oryza sativa subsp. indica TaxID=39946 RepID=B8AZQ3_ORYSI|nr:hypothetical protein OsI_19073 [Oryza sativa Indica Group]